MKIFKLSTHSERKRTKFSFRVFCKFSNCTFIFSGHISSETKYFWAKIYTCKMFVALEFLIEPVFKNKKRIRAILRSPFDSLCFYHLNRESRKNKFSPLISLFQRKIKVQNVFISNCYLYSRNTKTRRRIWNISNAHKQNKQKSLSELFVNEFHSQCVCLFIGIIYFFFQANTIFINFWPNMTKIFFLIKFNFFWVLNYAKKKRKLNQEILIFLILFFLWVTL